MTPHRYKNKRRNTCNFFILKHRATQQCSVLSPRGDTKNRPLCSDGQTCGTSPPVQGANTTTSPTISPLVGVRTKHCDNGEKKQPQQQAVSAGRKSSTKKIAYSLNTQGMTQLKISKYFVPGMRAHSLQIVTPNKTAKMLSRPNYLKISTSMEQVFCPRLSDKPFGVCA